MDSTGGTAGVNAAALTGLAVALGVGLLIGAERERRKSQRPQPATAGVRTFAVVALVGAVGFYVAGGTGLAVCTAIVGAVALVGAWAGRNSEDPGVTSEAALVLTVLLGGLAMREPQLAAMAGVATAILLAARGPIHRFVSTVLTERELADGLVLAAATLIVLPLLPDRAMGPFDALNPRDIWMLVILVLCVGAAGHIASRMIGIRFGLPLAGLLGGFASSAATIGAMGARARQTPQEAPAAAAAGVLSTVATMIQLGLVLAAVSEATLRALAPSLLAGGVVALIFGLVSTMRAILRPAPSARPEGGAFSLKSTLVFAALLSTVLVASAACRAYFGEAGLIVAAGFAGLVDAHAAAIAVASLAASGQIAPPDAVAPILIGVSTNTATKLVLAATAGGRSYMLRVGPGLVAVVTAIWLARAFLLRV